jgi:hypothetical protein
MRLYWDRRTFIATVVSLPPTSLHLVVSFLMEALLSTKEPSKKTRSVAFALLVIMGWKMKAGGVMGMSLLDGASTTSGGAGGARETSLEEFIGMVGASLAAEKDHTISAGVMALSRILFEFRSTPCLQPVPTKVGADQARLQVISPRSTSCRFSAPPTPSSLRGIVKSRNLCVHSLPAEVAQGQLGDIVRGLIGCLTMHRMLKVPVLLSCPSLQVLTLGCIAMLRLRSGTS